MRSPTIPRSENSKIGAFESLLIATMFSEVCMPTLCWIAPEMPAARYSFGATVLPVWPICAGVREPAGVDDRAGRGDGRVAAERRWRGPRRAGSPRPCRGRGRRRRGRRRPRCRRRAPRCSPRMTIVRLVGERRSTRRRGPRPPPAPAPDSRISNALRRPMMMPVPPRVVDLGDRGVAEDRALGDELAVRRRCTAVTSIATPMPQARGEAGADLEAEQAAAEQRVVVAAGGRSPRPSRRRPAARGPRGPRRAAPSWRRSRRASRRARR